MSSCNQEVALGQRFEFGRNWQRFLSAVDTDRVLAAEASLKEMLGAENLAGKRFLDVGCGSGLFSLAALRLGAIVHSFDFDPQSVACTAEMKQRFAPGDVDWTIEEGSATDAEYLCALGQFDVVYSWGVLHHTGAMWSALASVCDRVREDGHLYVAIYNDQGGASRRWALVKRTYCRSPRPVKLAILAGVGAFWASRSMLIHLVRLQSPLAALSTRTNGTRGMAVVSDLKDWVGGYPFEVARPEQVFDFCRVRGFTLARLTTAGTGHGCNEYVFCRRAGD